MTRVVVVARIVRTRFQRREKPLLAFELDIVVLYKLSRSVPVCKQSHRGGFRAVEKEGGLPVARSHRGLI